MPETRSDHRARHNRRNTLRLLGLAEGTWQPWGDIDAVRAHITYLLSQQWTLCAIATAAGTHPDLVRHVHQGRRKNITPRSAEKVLGVHPRHRVGWVPADGARRRLQAVAVHGHGVLVVARAIEVSSDTVCLIRQGERRTIRAGTARTIAAAYPRLLATAPIGDAAQVRRRALAAGWHGAGAWNRYTIDDPNARPLTSKENHTHA